MAMHAGAEKTAHKHLLIILYYIATIIFCDC